MLRFLTLSNILICALVCFIAPFAAMAGNLEDFTINSDELFIEKESGSSKFVGNVVIWFDNGIVIETTELILKMKDIDGKQTIDRIVIPKSVRAVKFESCSSDALEVTMIANSAEYIVEKSELRLSGGIYMQKDENLVKCDELLYYTKISKILTQKKK